MFDLLIKNGNIFGLSGSFDLAINNGLIVEIAKVIPADKAKTIIDAQDKFISPGFVDSHMHLDKVLTIGAEDAKTLTDAIACFDRYTQQINPLEYKNDVLKRARQIAHMAIKAGTTTLRSHVNIMEGSEFSALFALHELREELKNVVDIKITALPSYCGSFDYLPKQLDILENMCKENMVDFLGGAPHLLPYREEIVENIFSISQKTGIPLDLHVDESDEPSVACFEQIADLTLKYGLEGRVSCGHVTSLNAVDNQIAARVIKKAKQADLNIITLPSCNLYLMGRNDQHPIRRGVTRISEFLEAGVNISYASDNIRDPFRPFGNGDMLEEGLLTAQVAQMATSSDLQKIFTMGTYNPAKALLLSDYGIAKGKKADLLIFDAPTLETALISQAIRTHVIKNGKIIVSTEKIITTNF